MTDFSQNPFAVAEVMEHTEEPRVACLLVLDISYSMEGERIANLNKGLKVFTQELNDDSLASKRVEVGIITFGKEVSVAADFVSARDFRPPTLSVNGATPMGEAIVLAMDMVEARKAIYRQNGVQYYRPWIFLITDGGPTDTNESYWQSAINGVKAGEKGKKFAFYAVGVEEADFDCLRGVAVREPLKLKGLRFRELFKWLSDSLGAVSHSNPDEEVPLDSPSGWGTTPGR